MYISADINVVVDQAARYALRRRAPISTEHLVNAIKDIKPSLTKQQIEMYKNKVEIDND